MADHMPQAQYFHSTLYSFSSRAVEVVIQTFQLTVENNIAVKCFYVRGLEGFELICPQHLGPEANEALHDALSGYIEREIEEAETEEREPTIKRFPESFFDEDTAADVNDDDNEDNKSDRDTQAQNSATLIPRPSAQQGRALALHCVIDERNKSVIKLFWLRDTSEGMLERTLVHPGHKLEDAVRSGFTCRVAKWDPEQFLYAFNGRVGEAIRSGESRFVIDSLPACASIKLAGRAHDADLDEEIELEVGRDERTRQWNFVGEGPTVRQFLEGMGTTEFEDPETARDVSELPSDAVRYNAGPEHQVRSYGRNRRAAMTESASNADSGLSDTEESSAEDDEASEDDESNTAVNPMLQKLKTAATQQAQGSGDNHASATQDQGEASVATPKAEIAAPGSVVGHLSIPTATAPRTTGTANLPEYERSYAKVDRNGLTGHAECQAQYDLSNPVLPSKKINRNGIARRAPTQIEDLSPQPTSKSSTAMSLSTGADFRRGLLSPSPGSSFSVAEPIAMLDNCYEEPEPEEQPWANTLRTSALTSDTLIDVSIPRSRESTGRIRPPPGFEHSASKSSAASAASISTVKPDVRQQQMENMPKDLIDLTFDEPVRTKPTTNLSWTDPPLKPTVELPVISSVVSQNGDDDIIEKLQDTTNRYRPVRYTMRQKAAKKKKANKGKGGASATAKVQLPKPDPPPAPKPKPRPATEEAAGFDPQAEIAKPTEIEKLLRQVESCHSQPDVKLEVSLGMILVRSHDTSLCRGNWNSSSLQSALLKQEKSGELRTDFFDRLTTSETDAAYMLELLPGRLLLPKVEYELTLRSVQGQIRIVRFEQSDPTSFAIFCPEEVAMTLYMHYPIRVHDARSRIVRYELAQDLDSDEVASLVSSIHSLDGYPPSFKAMAPNKSFSVDKVHVKKVYAKEVVPGHPDAQLRVTEVQHLKFEPLVGSKHFNFKASATSRATMIDNHQLWYECSLYLAPIGGVEGDVLQKVVDTMVPMIDGVGYGNRGPYERAESEKAPEEAVPFW